MPAATAGYGPAMSWVMFDDALHGRVVAELQPTVVEVFRERTTDTIRVHLSMLQVVVEGPDGAGGHTVQLSAPGGRNGTRLTVDATTWPRLWPWVEQVRQSAYAFASQGYGAPPGTGLPPGYAPPPGFSGPPPPMGVPDP